MNMSRRTHHLARRRNIFRRELNRWYKAKSSITRGADCEHAYCKSLSSQTQSFAQGQVRWIPPVHQKKKRRQKQSGKVTLARKGGGTIKIEWHVCKSLSTSPRSPDRVMFTGVFGDNTDYGSGKVHGKRLDSAKEVASCVARFRPYLSKFHSDVRQCCGCFISDFFLPFSVARTTHFTMN